MSDSDAEQPPPIQSEIEPSNDYMNRLTLEMLMNRNNYNKYLAKTDPLGNNRQQEYKQKLQKYTSDILDITSLIIEDPDDSPNQEIESTFADFSKAVIKYLDMKELEKKNAYNQDDGYHYKKDNEDDDVMFDPNQMEESNHSLFNKPKWSGFNVKRQPTNRPNGVGGNGFRGHFV